MFAGFILHLRRHAIQVSVTEWLSLVDALAKGYGKSSLSAFYHLGRSLLVKKETQYDLYDRAFASYFEGVAEHFAIDDELWRWLENPVLPQTLTPEQLEQLKRWDLAKLREEFENRRRQQDERHDGGGHWIGTGGTSPFGHGGYHPQGVRVGGSGGRRSAVQVAEDRRFANLRNDRVLDTRLIGSALMRLRRLARVGPEELDIDATIDESARNGGEIDLVFAPERRNRLKVVLLMDVGGSMDPYVEACEQLFSAANKAHHFKAFEPYFFHNCVYERVYSDISRRQGVLTEELLRRIDSTWHVIFVGDAWMSPFELTHAGGHIYYGHHNPTPGIVWLQRLREACPASVWLNPENRNVWHADSIMMIRHLFPMFPLTLEGLTDAVDTLRGQRPNRSDFAMHMT